MTVFQDSHHFGNLWWQSLKTAITWVVFDGSAFLKRTLRGRFREKTHVKLDDLDGFGWKIILYSFKPGKTWKNVFFWCCWAAAKRCTESKSSNSKGRSRPGGGTVVPVFSHTKTTVKLWNDMFCCVFEGGCAISYKWCAAKLVPTLVILVCYIHSYYRRCQEIYKFSKSLEALVLMATQASIGLEASY